MTCDVSHGVDLIRAFYRDRYDTEARLIYYTAQPNGYNQSQSLTEFMQAREQSRQPQQTAADIMTEVRGIMAAFAPKGGTPNGDI